MAVFLVIVATTHHDLAGQVFHVLHRHVATVVLSVHARSAEDGEDVRARRRCDAVLAHDRLVVVVA